MTKNTLFLFLLIIFYSCKKSNELSTNETDFIRIEVTKKNKQLADLNQLLGDVNFIALENSKESFLSSINRIFEIENKLVIFDNVLNKINLFNNDGTFVRSIGKIGNGPGEYSNLVDITIDYKNSLIQALDIDNYKILNYNINGKFINSTKIKDPIFYLSNLNSNYMGYYIGYFSDDFYNLKIADNSNNIIYKDFKFPSAPNANLMKFSFTGFLTSFNNSFLYSDAVSSKIFKITPNKEINLKYIINFEKDPWPEDEIYNHFRFFQKVQKGQLSFLQKYEENKNALIFNYNHSVSEYPDKSPANVKLGIYIKKDKKVYSHFNFINDPFYKLLISQRGKSKDDQFFISKTNLSKLNISDLEKNKNNDWIIRKLKSQLDVTNEDFNDETSVLIYYKFK